MRLVDSHGHVQADPFSDDVEEVLGSAADAGVERLLVPGWDLPSSRSAVALAARRVVPPGTPLAGPPFREPPASPDMRPAVLRIDAAVGIHPHVAAGADEGTWAAIEELAWLTEVVAIGETGLDYDRAFSPREAQLVSLRRHLALGRATGKPVILHCRSARGKRDAHDDLLRELRAAGVDDPAGGARPGGRPPALLHSFSGPVDYAEAALELGLAVSFSGLVFRRGEEDSAIVAAIVPVDRLLVETDAPYLSPPGAPRRRNEPAWVRVTAMWLAARRGVDAAALGAALVRAYDGIFGSEAGGTLA